MSVRKGAAESVKTWVVEQGGQAPYGLDALVEGVATAGGTPLVVTEEGTEILGVVHLKDIVKDGMRHRFDELRAMGIRTVMITGDNPLTAQAIATEAGVDDFLAEATPEDKMDLIRREQAGGRLVAMTGDGTNDAPALAQADVGVAMNTGTQAAKEAGNMVDLDSNPTKLIEIVEIGKQLLITRGALTTFSIANDVAKYFAIIPAMFSGVLPALDRLNVMDLDTPRSAILSAVIFNALIIVALIPLSLRGVRFRAESAVVMLRRNLLIYGLGGVIAPFIGIKAIDLVISANRSVLAMRRQLLPALGMLLVFTVITGLMYPLLVTGIAQTAFADKADGSLIERDGVVVGSKLDRPAVRRARVLPPPPVGRRLRAGAQGGGTYSYGSNYGPHQRAFLDGEDDPETPDVDESETSGVDDLVEAYREENGLADDALVPVDAVTSSAQGLDPHISVANARLQARPRGRRAGARARRGARAHRRPHRRPGPRVPRRAGRERARAQPRPRRAGMRP